MTDMPRSKDRSRSEREKLREMNLKQKAEYIWSYYNYFIIGGLIAIGVISSLLTTCLNRPDIGLSVEWGSPFIEQSDLDTLMTALEQRLFNDGSGRVAEGTYIAIPGNEPGYIMQHTERLLAMLTAGAIDIFITDYDTMRGYSLLEFTLPFDVLFGSAGTEQYDDLFNKISDIAIYTPYGQITDETQFFQDDNYTSEPGPLRMTAIEITDSALLRELPVNRDNGIFLCVAVTVKNIDNAILAISEFMK